MTRKLTLFPTRPLTGYSREKLILALAPGDVVMVTRIDRLARSTFNLFGIVKRIVESTISRLIASAIGMRPPSRTGWRVRPLLMIILLLLHYSASADAALDCPAPPQQFARDIGVQGTASAEGLLKRLFEGSLQANVSFVAQDLISKYPHADRTIIAFGILSMYCQIIRDSNVSDDKKMAMVGEASLILLRWEQSAEDPSARLQGEVKELAHFPNGPESQPSTLLQAMYSNKLPHRLFDLLSTYTEAQIRGVPHEGDKLFQYKTEYYAFQSKVENWENTLLRRVAEIVAVHDRYAWTIYVKYVIMRFSGQDKEQIMKREGDGFLNMGITWDDLEKALNTLSQDQTVVETTREVFQIQGKLAREAKAIAGSV
jgi:hypothetical protein